MNKLIRSKYAIFLVLAIALSMRLVAISQSLWLDEAIGALAVRDFSFSEIISDFMKFDNHPPLYYLDLKAWTIFLGFSEIALRFPSIIYGVLTVYLIYLIAKKIFGNKGYYFPILATILLATSPFHIYYSQEARMYSLATFLASVAIYSFLFLLDERVRTYYWLLFSFSVTALIFTDYVPVFLLPVFWIMGAIEKKNLSWWRRFVFAHIPMVFLGIFWLPTFLIQIGKGKWLLTTLPKWQQIAGGATFKQAALVWMKFVLGRISFSNKLFYYSSVSIASIPFLLSGIYFFKAKQKFKIVRLWLLTPLILGFVLSFWIPLFIYFRFLYIIPAFYILVAAGVLVIKQKRFKYLLISSLILVNFTGWVLYVSDAHQQREQWREATFFVDNKVLSDETVIFEYPDAFSPYRWYSEGSVTAIGVTDSISADPVKTSQRTNEVISNKEGVYYFEYLRDLSDPDRIVEKTLQDSGFRIYEVYDYFPGVGQIFYWRKTATYD